MLRWRERGKGSSGGESSSDGDVSLPLGPGEWDSALGLPLCVVCQNVSICPFQEGWARPVSNMRVV